MTGFPVLIKLEPLPQLARWTYLGKLAGLAKALDVDEAHALARRARRDIDHVKEEPRRDGSQEQKQAPSDGALVRELIYMSRKLKSVRSAACTRLDDSHFVCRGGDSLST